MIEEIQISRGSGGDAIVIADGDPWGAGVVEEMKVGGVAVLDLVMFYQAVAPVFFDMDGRTNTVSFHIFREQPMRALALDRALRTPLLHTGKADIVLTLVENGVSFTWTAAGAGWTPILLEELAGYSSVLGYQVTCGPFDAEGNQALSNEDGTPLTDENGNILFNA